MIAETLTALFVIFFNINYALLLFSVIFPENIKTGRKSPSFTAIIANADSGSILRKTISNIRKANYPQRKVEIIVVDNTDRKDVAAAAKRYKAKLIKDTVSAGKGAALNMGIRKAKNEVLYFLDSDTLVGQDALKNIAKTISKKTPAVQGIFLPSNKDGLSSLMARLEIILMPIPNFLFYKFLRTAIISGRNFAIFKNTLIKTGDFGNTLTEDLELTRRLYERGIKVLFNRDVKAYELVPVKLFHMWKQHERWYGGGLGEIANISSPINFIALIGVVSTSFFYAALPVMGLIFISSGNIFALTGMAMGFPVIFYQASKYLTKAETLLSPLLVFALSIFSLAMIFNVLVKMLLNIKLEWYRTPKYA